MSHTDWLRRQVARLEKEISGHAVFESPEPATGEQLDQLRSKVVIHTYMKQQLLRREVVTTTPLLGTPPLPEDADTQEFVIVRRG